MKYKASNNTLKNLTGVRPVIMFIIADALAHEDCPYDFGVPQFGGVRTAKEQYSLYSAGISPLDGYHKKSKHQLKRAFDIFAYVDGVATWDIKYYAPLARHIMQIAKSRYGITLIWGGNWRKKDLVHFDITESSIDQFPLEHIKYGVL